MSYYVYILQSLKDSKYYIGSTSTLNERLAYHNNGEEDRISPADGGAHTSALPGCATSRTKGFKSKLKYVFDEIEIALREKEHVARKRFIGFH